MWSEGGGGSDVARPQRSKPKQGTTVQRCRGGGASRKPPPIWGTLEKRVEDSRLVQALAVVYLHGNAGSQENRTKKGRAVSHVAEVAQSVLLPA